MNDCKVLFHINSMGKGGAERVVSILSEYFAKDGYEVVVATQWYAGEEYPLFYKVKRIHVGLSKKDEKKNRLYRAIKRATNFRKAVRKEKPDIVISFCNKANFRSAYCMLGMKTPLLVSVRNDPKKDYAPYKRATKWMEKKAAGCVFQTPDARDFFDPFFREKSRIIFNPLSESCLNRGERVEKRDSRIVTVGRITVQKNQLLLLRAFAKIHEKYPKMQLEIYGEDDGQGSKQKMEQFLEQKGLKNKVHFMGQSSHVEKDIVNAALFVLSSDYEGMPNALIEAMALGLPVISTDCPCGGSGLLIEDGISGLLVPTGDEEKLAEAMESLLSDRERAERLGQEAGKVVEKVNPDKIYREWKEYVDELVQG